MTLAEHSKHAAISRPAYGNFGRNEWAIIGAPCGDIKTLAQDIIRDLSPVAKIAYVDAVHADEPVSLSGRLQAGACLEYTEYEGQQQFNYKGNLNAFQDRALFNIADMVLINGNHHQGRKQVIIIDSRKKTSLLKRLDQLSDVQLFLLADGEANIFEELQNTISNWQQIKVLSMNDRSGIISFFRSEWKISRPGLCGLVLAGGKSLRMGEDKGTIDWHGKEQRYHMADLLKNYTDEVFISYHPGQHQDLNAKYPTLTDTFTGLGPFGAILSAFREQPEKAWLVVACDLPLIDKATLDLLTGQRDTSGIATAFQSTYQNFPEPLVTIWEPKSYPVLLSFLAQGYSCPRKVLINSDVKVLQAPEPHVLTNVNTPEDRANVQAIIQNKKIG